MNDFTHNRTREARRLTTAAALLCGLGALSALVPAVEHALTLVTIGALALLVLLIGARFAIRRLRERREDHADALTAARWRAVHAPHLLDDTDRTHLTGRPAAVQAVA